MNWLRSLAFVALLLAGPPASANLLGGSHPLAITALAISSPTDAAAPWLDFDVLLSKNITVGDTITVRRSANPDMSSATSNAVVLTLRQLSTGVIDLGVGNLADGVWYFQVQATIGGVVQPPAPIQTITIAAGSAPGGAAHVRRDSPSGYLAAGGIGSFLRTMSFYNVDLGVPHASRAMLVGAAYQTAAIEPVGIVVVTDKDIAAANASGTTLTQVVRTTITNSRGAGQWLGAIAAGRPATVTLLANPSVGVIQTSALYNVSTTAKATQFTNDSAPADDFTLTAVTIGAGEFAVAFAGIRSGSSSRTWKNNYTAETEEVTVAAERIGALAVSTTAGSSAASVQRGVISTAMVVSVWGP